MKRHSPLIAILILASITALSLGASSPSSAPTTTPLTASSARGLMDQFIPDILAILRDPKLTRPEKRHKVRDLAYACIDFDTLSRLTMGQYWRGLTDAQHAAFIEEFKKHLAATYGHTTDEYTDEDIKISSDRQESNGDWTVLSRVIGTKDGTRQEIAKVDYRLRKKDKDWKIIDVTIDGVSLMTNFRSQFQDIMSNGGYDKLIKDLRAKNATAED